MTQVRAGTDPTARPAKPYGWLLFLEGDRVGQPLVVTEGPNVLGRDRESCESWRNQNGVPNATVLVLADPSVSRVHLLLEVGANGCTVKDLRSANKTSMGGAELAPMKPYPLPDRSRLSVSQLAAVFIRIPGPEAGEDTAAAGPLSAPILLPMPEGDAGASGNVAARLTEAEQTLSICREQMAAAERFARDIERQLAKLEQAG